MLVEDLKKGSSEAYKALVEQYSRTILNTCYSFLHNREDAEDVAQEVFIEIYRSIAKFDGKSGLDTWIYRISINKSLDSLRKMQRKKRIANLKELFFEKHNDQPANPHQILEEKERAKILNEQIASLPENQRIAIVLSRYDNMSNGRIAEIMNVSEAAVESLLHRAKENLRKKLAKYFEKIYK